MDTIAATVDQLQAELDETRAQLMNVLGLAVACLLVASCAMLVSRGRQ
jgi:hypothetical protein